MREPQQVNTSNSRWQVVYQVDRWVVTRQKVGFEDGAGERARKQKPAGEAGLVHKPAQRFAQNACFTASRIP